MKVLIAGDFMVDSALVEQTRTAPLASEALSAFIGSHDHAIVNFESTVGDGARPAKKSGPSLSSPSEALAIVKQLGFTAVCLANNHAMDFGRRGLKQTLEAVAANGLLSVGAGPDEAAANAPLVLEHGGCRLGVVNVTHREWGIAHHSRPGVNGTDLARDIRTIAELKATTNFVLAVTHLGHEYFAKQTPMARTYLTSLAEHGADVVVNHHPHVTGGALQHLNSHIFSSIGNFLFSPHLQSTDQRTRRGLLVSMECEPGSRISVTPVPVFFDDVSQCLDLATGSEFDAWKVDHENASEAFADEGATHDALLALTELKRMQYLSYLEPLDSKLLRAARRLGLWKGAWAAQRKRTLLNVIRCETHREALITILEDELDG